MAQPGNDHTAESAAADAFFAEEPSADAGLAAAAPARNFCPRCGRPWEPGWAHCNSCERNPAERARATRRPQVAFGLGLYFALLAATGVALLTPTAPAMRVHHIIVLEAVDAAIVAVAALLAFKTVAKSIVTPVAARFYLAALAAAGALYLVATGVLAAEKQLLNLPRLHLARMFFAAGWGWPAILATICLQPAVVEEIAFRGIILPALQPTLSARDAIVVSALLFMTLHLSVAAFPYLLLLGLVLGYLRVRSGSIMPGMVLHFSYNLLCLVVVHH